MSSNKIYFAVSDDKYELPVGVCSEEEIRKVHNRSALTVKQQANKSKKWRSVVPTGSGRHKSKLSPDWIREFYLRVMNLIDQKGVDITTFAKRNKVARQFFYSNGCAPSIEKLIKLADILGVTTDYLLGREELNNDKRRNRRV